MSLAQTNSVATRRNGAIADRELTWHAGSLEDVLALVLGSPKGLSSSEAARRLLTHGRNELRQGKQIRPLNLFVRQFRNLLVGILFGASVISGVAGDWFDAGVILTILFLDALVGFYQDFSAEKSIAALKRMTAPVCAEMEMS
jgi:Ca2+-transporting ATPase